MHKKINVLLLVLSFVLAWNWHSAYKENTAIKKYAIQQFIFNQLNVEQSLDQVTENQDDPAQVLFHLARATSFMDKNIDIAANGGFGRFVPIPYEFFLINVDQGKIVYLAYSEALKGELAEETLEGLKRYRIKISVITAEIPYSHVEQWSIRDIYKKLKEVAEQLRVL